MGGHVLGHEPGDDPLPPGRAPVWARVHGRAQAALQQLERRLTAGGVHKRGGQLVAARACVPQRQADGAEVGTGAAL